MYFVQQTLRHRQRETRNQPVQSEGPNLRVEPRHVHSMLRSEKLGRSILVVDQCQSTNTLADELAKAGARDGFVVIAEKQINGIGRHGREWLSPEGGIWMSIVLRPDINIGALECVPLIAALAVAHAINEVHNLNVSVRWPNDVILDHRKLAGTIAEARVTGQVPEYVILGIGINSNFPSTALNALVSAATTLSDAIGHTIDRAKLLARILLELEPEYERISKGQYTELMHSLKQTDCSTGRRLTVHLEHETVTGVFEGYLTPMSVQIVDDHYNRRQIETSGAVLVQYHDA